MRVCGSYEPMSACRWLWKGSTGQQGKGQRVACASGAAAAVKGQSQAAAQFLPRTWIPITFIHQGDRPTLRTDLGLSSGFAFGGTDVLTRPVAAARATWDCLRMCPTFLLHPGCSLSCCMAACGTGQRRRVEMERGKLNQACRGGQGRVNTNSASDSGI